MFTIIIFILVLSILVFAHELGHFSTARFFKIKVDEFGLGFPPRAIGWYRNKKGKRLQLNGNIDIEKITNHEDEDKRPAKGATVYSLNWLPIGGFVKIKGENGDDRQDSDSFGAKPIWQRAIVLAAGVIMNIVLAWFVFSIGYMIGLPQSADAENLSKRAIVSDQAVALMDILPDSVAERAELKAGDVILSVAGVEVKSDVALQREISLRGGEETEIVYEREGEVKSLVLVPEIKGDSAVIGVAIFTTGSVRYPFFDALIEGAKITGWMLKEIVLAFGNLFGDMFAGKKVGDQFAGPIGIANITGQAASLGFVYLLQFIGILSLNLAIINILPFPALDGGRLLFLLIEKIKGRPIKKEIENAFNNIGFMILIALIIFVTFKDVMKLF